MMRWFVLGYVVVALALVLRWLHVWGLAEKQLRRRHEDARAQAENVRQLGEYREAFERARRRVVDEKPDDPEAA